MKVSMVELSIRKEWARSSALLLRRSRSETRFATKAPKIIQAMVQRTFHISAEFSASARGTTKIDSEGAHAPPSQMLQLLACVGRSTSDCPLVM